MKKERFTTQWLFCKEGSQDKQTVVLPHDAMIHEKRDPKSPGEAGHGYFVGGKYLYEKTFEAPIKWQEQNVFFEFEGVYRNAVVTINGKEAGRHAYGYTPFLISADGFLNYGGENVIAVSVDNSQIPNSRWYSGSGIYRPVSLIVGNKTHIEWQGVHITTTSYAPAKIKVETRANGGEVAIEILDKVNVIATAAGNDVEIQLDHATLWSDENPYLYQCHVTLTEDGNVVDEVTENFGVRMVEWSNKGLFVNGKETLLRGGCYHHDNGILGAATWDKSEERRVRIMKENGFNAIRSSHNPTSNALVDACDKYGMYLMDETFDMWYMPKTRNDYSKDFQVNWQADTKAMVERDYNHPSVIMYSIGNEVSEPAEEKGVAQTKAFVDFIHGMDTSRAVTGGINLMIIFNASKGKGQYKDVGTENEKVNTEAKSGEKEGKSGSLLFNTMATFVGTGMNKGANSDKADAVTSPCLDLLDIAGYNYASGRYPLEAEKHPNRVIYGSETFPQDIYRNWEMVKKYPYLVGDFMWTSWDYLGESGIGAWSYTGGMPFNRPYPWVLGGAGVINILGYPDAECRYAQVAWDQIEAPVIGVRPANHPGVRVSKSVWRGTNATENWSYENCDGNKTIVEIYSKAPQVEVLTNGKSMGKKKTKECKAEFKTKYQSGNIVAIAYDASGNKLGESQLESAIGKKTLRVTPEENEIAAGDIVYIPVDIVGENGIVECNHDVKLSVTVKGGELLAFGSANPCTVESYDAASFTTYYGRAMAIVRGDKAGKMTITVTGGDFSAASAEVVVK